MATRQFLYQHAEGYADSASTSDDTQLAKIVLTGLSGVGADLSNQKIVNLASPVAGTDAANKAYVDAAAVGIDWKPSVRLATTANLVATRATNVLTADANGALSVDSVSPIVGDRILVKDQTTGQDNGIYEVTAVGDGSNPFVLTRTTDADTSAEVTAGLAVFSSEGTINGDTGWVLITNDVITLNTTALTFTQFTGLGSITPGAGISSSGATINVELDTGANAQGAGTGGGSSGLEFDTSGAAGKLRAAVDGTGGLDRTASGLAVLMDNSPTTLSSSASGLKVVGLPSLFQINNVAVSANVTAANLTTLTGGGDASALHVHDLDSETWTASGAITKGDGVYISANNVVSTGDCTNDAKSRVIGVANANIADTVAGKIVRQGVITGVLSGATFNTRYFLGSSGQPVLIGSLGAGSRTVQVGIAKNATDLLVRVFDYGKKP